VGAEAFAANSAEKWLAHPASIKALGDWAFCEGINRFVFHRYALQPWTNPDRPPGMSMGPRGLHYERTQTWWEQSSAWHEYLARCQFLLRYRDGRTQQVHTDTGWAAAKTSGDKHSDPGIRHYSGTATYRATFILNPKTSFY
jgi:hypothetical protein